MYQCYKNIICSPQTGQHDPSGVTSTDKGEQFGCKQETAYKYDQ